MARRGDGIYLRNTAGVHGQGDRTDRGRPWRFLGQGDEIELIDRCECVTEGWPSVEGRWMSRDLYDLECCG